jgi:CheY-like chemotaxis protein
MIDRKPHTRASGHPTDWLQPLRPTGPAAAILLVDDDPARAELTSSILAWHGMGRPDRALSGDEALDRVAGARQLELVILAMPLPDDDQRDVESVLRRHNAPFRIARQGAQLPWEVAGAARYRGVAVVLDMAGSKGIARDIDAVLRSDWTVGHIMASQTVPTTLTKGWAEAIYGARPGQPFLPSSRVH